MLWPSALGVRQPTLVIADATPTSAASVIGDAPVAAVLAGMWCHRRYPKFSGCYYTPPEVVSTMVRPMDDALRSPQFGQHAGLASPTVTLADPATGTGTFILGVLRRKTEERLWVCSRSSAKVRFPGFLEHLCA
jgi:hypothetical protein